jgi:hypothetical protein
MKSIKFLTVVLGIFLFSSCATIYQSPDLHSRTVNHQKIAFLPFDVTIQYRKLPKNTSLDQIKEMEEDMGYVFQEQMYTRFLQKINYYNVEFQDISQTNALLKKNDVVYSNYKEFTKTELAEILKVDAVISGKILTSKPMSTGGAIALGVLTGYSAATNKVDVNVTVHDASDSKLLFKYDHSYSGGVGSSPEQLAKALMRHIEKNFPYRN